MSRKNSRKLPTTFEDLLDRQYGAGADPFGQLEGVDSLIAGAYGTGQLIPYGTPWGRLAPAPPPPRPPVPAPVATSQSVDDGEVLSRRRTNVEQEEYCVPDAPPAEEYVVRDSMARAKAPADVAITPARGLSAEVAPAEEYAVDVLAPLGAGTAPAPIEVVPVQPDRASGQSPAKGDRPAAAYQPPAAPAPAPGTSKEQATTDDFTADMKAILEGKMLYDRARPGGATGDGAVQAAVPGDAPQAQAQTSTQQTILDRIAQSMKYASTFDLGTVELDKRFTDFDQLGELEQRTRKPAASRQASIPSSAPAGSTAEFLEDLGALQREKAQSVPGDMAQPLYDTGEHVLAGGDLYVDRLRVGKSPGVLFSYGEIVAMADLYEEVDDLWSAEVAELQQIKALIDRSTAYYTGGKRDDALDVDDEQWQKATRDRYLALAEENYQHFSPNTLFKLAGFGARKGDHRSAWEAHHRRALDQAQRILREGQGRRQSVFPESALVINAFGDHFLTDAFAAGHLVNKEEIVALFRKSFFDGSSLNGAGEEFFGKVAGLAWKGEVKQRFSVLETYEPRILWWHPNIDTEHAFKTLLISAANQEPGEIANFAVRAIHDDLNENGLEVTNDAGDGTFTIKGDGFLDPGGGVLAIMKRAVAQSAANVADPLLATGPVDLPAFYARVWRYVPRPTTASQARLAALSREYTRPESSALATRAADLITRKVRSFVNELLKLKKLRPA
jgi:hypothetical protein